LTDQPVRHAPFFAENDFTLFSNITKAADNHTRIISISDCFNIEYIPSDIVHIELLHRAIRYAYDRKVVIVAGVGEGNQDKSICGGPQELFKDGDGGI